MKKLPKRFVTEAEQFVNVARRNNFIAGRFLIMQMLDFFNIKRKMLENLKISASGRPYIEGNLDFNLSHSGNLVVCAGSIDSRIGIDIEEKRNIKPETVDIVLTDEELNTINTSPQPSEKLLELWTKKESLAKATGVGILNEFKDIIICNDKGYIKNDPKPWYFYPVQMHPDYIGHLCTRNETQNLITEAIRL
jgi:4'-phosphopantetheinyl transferase